MHSYCSGKVLTNSYQQLGIIMLLNRLRRELNLLRSGIGMLDWKRYFSVTGIPVTGSSKMYGS